MSGGMVSRAVVLGVLVCACGGGSATEGPAPPGGWKPPQILTFSPTAGPVGTTVLLQGILFGERPGQNTVRFGGVTGTVQSASATEIVAVVPSGAKTGPIEVATPGGSDRTAKPFTVLSDSVPGAAWSVRLAGPRGDLAGLAWDGKKLVAVGDSIQTSTDVSRWEERMSLTGLQAVAWNGVQYAAVGKSWRYSSATGLTWNRSPVFDADLQALASSGSRWVAVGRRGAIRTSTDGATWTAASSPTDKDLRAVAWSGSQFVVVGREGMVLTSPDGLVWTVRTGGSSDDFTAVGATSSLMVATTFPSNNSPSAILTSPDGVTWTERARSLPWGNSIMHAAGRWVLAGDYRVVTSSDGVNWAVSATDVGILDAIVHTGDQFVAVGSTGSSVPAVYTSADAQRWTMRSSAQRLAAVARSSADGRLVAVALSNISLASTDDGATWQFGGLVDVTGKQFADVEWFAKLGAFVALVVEGANEGIYTSPDGLVWTRVSDGSYLGALGASPTLLVNVGTDLTGRGLATSADGVTWTRATALPATEALREVFWTGSQLIAVGSGGAILTSPDGVAWTLRASGTTATLQGAAASSGLTVVAGADGTILTSSDGATWSARPSGTRATLRRVAWTGGEFVALGSAGTALRSTDGMSWSVQPTPFSAVPSGSDPFDLNDAVWTDRGGRLVVVGTRGLVATSP